MVQTFLPDEVVANPGGWRRELKHGGQAQSGTATTIVLDTGASAVDDEYNGDLIELTEGTGADPGETVEITDYVGSTRTATVAAWTNGTPDSTTLFEIREAALEDGINTSNLALWIESPVGPVSASIRFGLSGGVDPASTATHTVSVTYWKPDAGGARIDITYNLYGGGGLILTRTFVDIPSSPFADQFNLTVPEIEDILQADYEGDLEDEFVANTV